MDDGRKFLAGDIGGTKTALAIFEIDRQRETTSKVVAPLRLCEERVYPSQDYPSFDAIVRSFLEETGASPQRAAFGVAGPVVGGSVEVTNLPWRLDADTLMQTYGFDAVRLINDVEANGWGLEELDATDLVPIGPRRSSAAGHRALVSPGTGLGIAVLYWDGNVHRPYATEGGHAGFGPETKQERRLLEFAMERAVRIRWEDILAGPGLSLLYEFIVAEGEFDPEEDILAAIRNEEGPPQITARGLDGSSPAAREVLRLYIRLLGSCAGNAVLHHLAIGGVVLGGGIVPRIAHRLEADGFLQSFVAKSPMDRLLQNVSVHAVMSSKAALWGAARVAAAISSPSHP